MEKRKANFTNFFIVAVVAAVFFAAVSSFNLLSQSPDYVKWSSPDESANYFFTKRFALTGEMAFFDQAAVSGDNMVMPRSLRGDFGWLKPVSFLGIILVYGVIAAWFGISVIPFLTPAFAALGIVVFYFFVRKIFNSDRIGLWSSVLLATFPVYIYYSARSMFHNVLFIVLLIFGLFLLASSLEGRNPEKQRFFSWRWRSDRLAGQIIALAAGIVIGLAAIVRTSELIWLLPALGLLWLFYVRRFGLARLLFFLVGLVLALTPVLNWNTALYGSPWRGGYNEMNRSLDNISATSGEAVRLTLSGQIGALGEKLHNLADTIFYFGFNARQSWEMFIHYVPEMFPFLFWAGAFGLLLLFIQNIFHFRRRYLAYLSVWLLASLILVLYYGSWRFNDNPDPTRFTIGNSYTRYWLPLYLGLMPLAALAAVRLSRAFLLATEEKWSRVQKILASGWEAIVMLAIALPSLLFVFAGSEEGLVYLYHNNQAEQRTAEVVFSLTEPDAVIITQYYDKVFWPERRVIMGRLPDAQILEAARKLAADYPVYYYNFYLNQADLDYLNQGQFAGYGLKISLVEKLNGRFGLYRLSLYDQAQDQAQ